MRHKGSSDSTLIGKPYRVKDRLLLCIAVSTLLLCGSSSPSAEPFAVVELFTSEGCSSCPPAERLLGEIAERAKKDGSRIFPMAFHVDYWNRLGWHDPFSDPAHSRRQRRYARALGSPRRIYTPQMIVNGVEGFVGSNREQAYKSIDRMLSGRDEEIGLVLEARAEETGKRIGVSYQVEGKPERAILNVALLEDGITREITRGENAGRRLNHGRVVRAFKSVSLDLPGKGRLEVSLPESMDLNRVDIVGFVQDPESMAVLGAGQALFPGRGNRLAEEL